MHLRQLSAFAGALLLICGVSAAGSAASGSLVLTSPAFPPGGRIPQRFASKLCGGQNFSPPLAWHGAPPLTQSFALTIYDPRGRGGAGLWLWVVYDIPHRATGLPSAPDGKLPKGLGRRGANGHGLRGYFGPCPPKGDLHRYRFTLYALDSSYVAVQKTDPPKVGLAAMSSYVLTSATLTGTYSR
jgi:Raf kinase inhibitor-like YbhB/YbcL family protein